MNKRKERLMRIAQKIRICAILFGGICCTSMAPSRPPEISLMLLIIVSIVAVIYSTSFIIDAVITASEPDSQFDA